MSEFRNMPLPGGVAALVCTAIVCAANVSCRSSTSYATGESSSRPAARISDCRDALATLRALPSDSPEVVTAQQSLEQAICRQTVPEDVLTSLLELFVHGDDHVFPGSPEWARKYLDLYMRYTLVYDFDPNRDQVLRNITPLRRIDYPAHASGEASVWVDAAESWALVHVTPLASWRGFEVSAVRAQAIAGGAHVRFGEPTLRPVSGCILVPVPRLDPGRYPISFTIETGTFEDDGGFDTIHTALLGGINIITIVETAAAPDVLSHDTSAIREAILARDWVRLHRRDDNDYDVVVNTDSIMGAPGVKGTRLSLFLEIVHGDMVLWRSVFPGGSCERLHLGDIPREELALRIRGDWWKPGRSVSANYRDPITFWDGEVMIDTVKLDDSADCDG